MQPLGTVRPQTSPGPGPTGDRGPQPQTPPDTSTRSRQPAAPTQGIPEPHPHHSPPVRPTEGPTHAPSAGPPRQTCTATPTDATSTRPGQPLGTMRLHARNPTRSPSPQAPATPSTSAPGYRPPALAQAKPASQQLHNPPKGPAVRPTETPSGNRPAPNPDPDPDPTHATVPADAPRANAPGRELPTGVPHPEGGTPVARPAAAEGTDGRRHWQSTWEASPGRHTRQMAKPEKWRNWHTAQPCRRHCPPSHNARSPRWTPRRKRGDPRSGKKRHCQRRTYPPRAQPERRYLPWWRASQKTSTPARRPIARRTWRHAEAATHQTLVKLVRNLGDQLQTPSMPPASPH